MLKRMELIIMAARKLEKRRLARGREVRIESGMIGRGVNVST